MVKTSAQGAVQVFAIEGPLNAEEAGRFNQAVAAAPRAVVAPAPVARAVAAPTAPAPAVKAAPAAAPAPVAADAGGTPIKAPLPGMIIRFNKNVGDAVTKGEAVVVLEAMKMENALVAPCDGVVKAIKFSSGDNVAKGATLALIE